MDYLATAFKECYLFQERLVFVPAYQHRYRGNQKPNMLDLMSNEEGIVDGRQFVYPQES